MSKVRAWAALAPGQSLARFEYDACPLPKDEVEVTVEYCGLCHSDLAIIANERLNPAFPCVPGHEIIGRVVAVGEAVDAPRVGQHVGIGWTASSCMHCPQCVAGNQNICQNVGRTIVGHYGGFAERVRAQWLWAFLLPEELDRASAGPLMCGGITVFSSLLTNNVKPTDHVGVLGIGGLGHLAIKFAKAWGCEVTALTSSPSKFEDVRALGADHAVCSTDETSFKGLLGELDFLLVTSAARLDWSALFNTLRPKGRLHVVGYTGNPVALTAAELIAGGRSVGGSSTGTPSTMAKMLEFASRHRIAPQVEHFAMSKVNQAMDYLKAGKPRYRVVLDADFAP